MMRRTCFTLPPLVEAFAREDEGWAGSDVGNGGSQNRVSLHATAPRFRQEAGGPGRKQRKF